MRQGQEMEGKLLLGKALRFAHGYLCNQQLVSQVREMVCNVSSCGETLCVLQQPCAICCQL